MFAIFFRFANRIRTIIHFLHRNTKRSHFENQTMRIIAEESKQPEKNRVNAPAEIRKYNTIIVFIWKKKLRSWRTWISLNKVLIVTSINAFFIPICVRSVTHIHDIAYIPVCGRDFSIRVRHVSVPLKRMILKCLTFVWARRFANLFSIDSKTFLKFRTFFLVGKIKKYSEIRFENAFCSIQCWLFPFCAFDNLYALYKI